MRRITPLIPTHAHTLTAVGQSAGHWPEGGGAKKNLSKNEDAMGDDTNTSNARNLFGEKCEMIQYKKFKYRNLTPGHIFFFFIQNS